MNKSSTLNELKNELAQANACRQRAAKEKL